MRFGRTTEEAEKEPSRGGSGGGFMSYMKDGDNYLQLADEPDQWVWYWEHFNPEGFAYPCTNERDTCPGCTSENEKVKKASRKVAFNAYDGEFMNVWKVPKTVAEKLRNRFDRLGTVTDRPYIVTRMKNGQTYDYDLEGQDKSPIPSSAMELKRDPEDLLAQAYDDTFGTSSKVATSSKLTVTPTDKAAHAAQLQPEDPPSEAAAKSEPVAEKVVSEEALRAMTPVMIRSLCESEGYGKPPVRLKTANALVDWMIEQP